MIRLQLEAIEASDLVSAVAGDGDGAVCLFLGRVRDHNRGRNVLHLEYEAYERMAVREMRRIADEASERFGLSGVALVHRTGRVEVGDSSVGVAVACPHRAEAFEACRFIIDSLKQSVPIWKKEFYEGGSFWIGSGS